MFPPHLSLKVHGFSNRRCSMLISATAGRLRVERLHFIPILIVSIEGTETVHRSVIKAISSVYPGYQIYQYDPTWAYLRPVMIHGSIWYYSSDNSVMHLAIVRDIDCPKTDWIRPRMHCMRERVRWTKSQTTMFDEIYLFTRAMCYTLTYTDY